MPNDNVSDMDIKSNDGSFNQTNYKKGLENMSSDVTTIILDGSDLSLLYDTVREKTDIVLEKTNTVVEQANEVSENKSLVFEAKDEAISWASKDDGPVENNVFSSKHYAQVAESNLNQIEALSNQVNLDKDYVQDFANISYREFTWTDLSNVDGIVGQLGYVDESDKNFHTDPVTQEQVKNSGIYKWTSTGLGSLFAERVGNTGLADKANLDFVSQELNKREVIGQNENQKSTIPTSESEAIIVTQDGRVLLSKNGDLIVLGTATFEVDGAFNPFSIKTPDGYVAVDLLNDGTFRFSGLEHEIDPFSAYRMQTLDGQTLLDFDAITGGVRVALSPDRFEISGDADKVDGRVSHGRVSDVRGSGEWFAYHVDGQDYVGKVIGRRTGDWAAGHIADTTVLDVIESDGQSWQTISDYTADEIDFEETSGETSAAVRLAMSPMVTCLRDAADVGVVLPDGDLSGLQDTISDGDLPGDLHRFDPKEGFSISRMSAVARARFQRRMGLPANPAIVLNVGWPGTSSEKFLPEGSSYNYTDDNGDAQTTTAVEHPTAGAYLWARNVEMRDAVKSVIDARWFARPLNYEFLTWIQGPFEDGGNAAGFMAEYRTQQDALSISGQTTQRHILWDQNGGTTFDLEKPNGAQSQLEFCQANASGKDWLVGPRYPHYLYDKIHHSPFGAIEYAERTGQAMAYIQKYGNWESLWIESVIFSGATCTITTNRPRQCVGDLIIDSGAITARLNHGFTLWNVASGAEIAITDVSILGDQIVLTTDSTLSGEIEVGYAARSLSARNVGTVATPEHSATWGNIKMKGRDKPAVIPSYVQESLDHWLCAFKKTYTV